MSARLLQCIRLGSRRTAGEAGFAWPLPDHLQDVQTKQANFKQAYLINLNDICQGPFCVELMLTPGSVHPVALAMEPHMSVRV